MLLWVTNEDTGVDSKEHHGPKNLRQQIQRRKRLQKLGGSVETVDFPLTGLDLEQLFPGPIPQEGIRSVCHMQ